MDGPVIGSQVRLSVLVVSTAVALLACSCAATPSARGGSAIVAVGAENEYSNVIAQIGGRYVDVTAIMSNPNVDPHSFEASPSVARVVSAAQLIVQNGLGYDAFMNTIEAASPDSKRKVVDVQKLLGRPDTTPNPHLWYSPGTMLLVAKTIAVDLSDLDPAHASYFRARLVTFEHSFTPWLHAIAAFKADFPHVPVATTEPVADYMLQAVGADNKTPFALQADIMNGVDPAPEDITIQEALLSSHSVDAFVYNEQVTDSITESFLALAKKNGIPVVGVYETMPTPGYDYQTWMVAEVQALKKAITDKISTGKL